MSAHGFFQPPTHDNEPVKSYAPGTPERAELQARLRQMQGERISIPMIIGGKDVHADETFEAAKFREVFTRQIVIPPSLPPIAVRSAFGGLGIYRLPAALAARYHGVDATGRETSEHVAFNTTIGRAGGRLHIFPALQVHAPHQHLYQPSEFRWRWRMTMMARRTAEIARPSWRRMLVPT